MSRPPGDASGAKNLEGNGLSNMDDGHSAVVEVIEQQVRQAWPDLDLDVNAFVLRLSVLNLGGTGDLDHLPALAISDLALAFACSQGDPNALQLFAREYESDLRAVASKFGVSETEVNDTRQALWDRLFVSRNGEPGKIVEYRGKGRLRHWLRAVLTRLIVDRLRQTRPNDRPSRDAEMQALQTAASSTDLELSAIRRRYGHDFREAFEFAVTSLEPDERNAVKCYYLLDMTIDQMAATFGTHRATAARRVARAKEKLHHMTLTRLKERLGADTGEAESIMRLYDREASITLSSLLR